MLTLFFSEAVQSNLLILKECKSAVMYSKGLLLQGL